MSVRWTQTRRLDLNSHIFRIYIEVLVSLLQQIYSEKKNTVEAKMLC